MPETHLEQAPRAHQNEARLRSAIAGWIPSLLLLLAVVATWPFVEMGVHDDWSYIYCVRVFADTGHVVYNGWVQPMLGWLLPLGALFIKVFGFSFTAVRGAGLLTALLAVRLFYAVLTRLGVRPWNATVGTLTLALSPLFLALAPSLMSDVPSLFCLMVCLYGCVRAIGAETDRASVGWLVFAAASNVMGGTVRQIAWMGVLVMVPSTVWLLRKRRGMLLTGAVTWAVSLLAVFATVYWFNHQPYASVERAVTLQLNPAGLRALAKATVKAVITVFLLLSPVMTGFVLKYPQRRPHPRRALLATVGFLLVSVAAISMLHPQVRWLTFLLGDYVSPKGILELPWLLGTVPDAIPRPVQALVAFVTFAMAAACLLRLWFERGEVSIQTGKRLLNQPLFWLLGPFTAAYLLLVMTRAALFDRYLLPVMVVLLIVALQRYQQRYGQDLPALCLLPMALLALYGVMGTHDLFAGSRARLAAANEIRAAGVPRGELRAGFEYDGWTQIELAGYINEPRIRIPADAYKPWSAPSGTPAECVFWFSDYTPAIHARYELSNQPDFCFPNAPFAPVTYRTWLPPHSHTIYILQVPPASPTYAGEASSRINAR